MFFASSGNFKFSVTNHEVDYIKSLYISMQDVGQAILESYSRVLESLAFNLMARIEDLLYVDDATRHRSAAESPVLNQRENIGAHSLQKWAFF